MFKLKILIISLLIFSCFDNSVKTIKNNEPKNKIVKIPLNLESDNIKGYLGEYLKLKNSLIKDDIEATLKIQITLENELRKINYNSMSSEKQNDFSSIIDLLLRDLSEMKLKSIKKQRIIFDKLSQNVMSLIKLTGSNEKIYQHYCPMFNENKGGMWLSSSKEIYNPLFGSKMLKCGYVKGEIN